MIPWYWILVAFVGGCLFGEFLAALMIANGKDDHRGE